MPDSQQTDYCIHRLVQKSLLVAFTFAGDENNLYFSFWLRITSQCLDFITQSY